MLAECDFIALAPILTDETRGMIDADAFAAMKDGATVLNVARGEVIDERALKDACAQASSAEPTLDVYEDEWSRPLTPNSWPSPTS